MANHDQIVRDQLLHMLSATSIFVVLGSIAVALDAAGDLVSKVDGVSVFTQYAIEITAHVMLMVDLALFATYLYKSTITLFKAIVS